MPVFSVVVSNQKETTQEQDSEGFRGSFVAVKAFHVFDVHHVGWFFILARCEDICRLKPDGCSFVNSPLTLNTNVSKHLKSKESPTSVVELELCCAQ